MVAVIGVLLFLAMGLAIAADVLTRAELARASADQAALAAASALLDVGAGRDPCAQARYAAVANGADVTRCRVFDTSVQVDVVLGGPLRQMIRASARAGAPE